MIEVLNVVLTILSVLFWFMSILAMIIASLSIFYPEKVTVNVFGYKLQSYSGKIVGAWFLTSLTIGFAYFLVIIV